MAGCALLGLVPWLSEEIPDWDELSEKEKDAIRDALRDLGMCFPDEEQDDEDDYYE